MSEFAMFPLGSVLFPHMPLALRVFEQRYLVMLATVLQDEPSEFGVVLIERGQEVGGGEHRFGIGTVARIVELDTAEGYIAVVAEGGTRIQIEEWLDDDPHPRAVVRELPELEWHDDLQPKLDRAEQLVRRTVARASEFVDLPWPSDVGLSEDPVERAWQLAGIAPLGPLDQVALLRAETLEGLLDVTIEFTTAASLDTPW